MVVPGGGGVGVCVGWAIRSHARQVGNTGVGRVMGGFEVREVPGCLALVSDTPVNMMRSPGWRATTHLAEFTAQSIAGVFLAGVINPGGSG